MTPGQTTRSGTRVASLCRDILPSLVLPGAAYGLETNTFGASTVGDLELTSAQLLLLGLLRALVARDIMSSTSLAELCHSVQRLRSRHLRVWILEDFEFPWTDIQDAMAFLAELVAGGTMKLPSHVMTIMTSLAKKYKIVNVQLITEEFRHDLEVQLENAVINDSPRDIFELKSEGANVFGLTQSGDTFLHLAARAGSSASIEALSFLYVDPEVIGSNNGTPLEEAVRSNRASSVKALLNVGAKFDKRSIGGDTYLHIAAAGGHNEALEALLEAGIIDINEKNQVCETPLAQAVRAGNFHGVELLQKEGADFSSIIGVRYNDGDSIVHSVARSGYQHILKLLKDEKIPANIKNLKGLTPLHVASNISVVKTLLRMGVDVNSQDITGRTALMVAAGDRKADIVSSLLINRADPNFKDTTGRTALHYAAKGGCTSSVSVLLETGVGVNECSNNGDTPAFVAAVSNHPAVLELLVDNEADLDLRDGKGRGILHRGAMIGHVEVVRTLLDAGVGVNVKDEVGNTALNHAAGGGHTAVAAMLLDRGADINEMDDGGWTALHLAALKGHTTVVELLLARGADLEAGASFRSTPLMAAVASSSLEVVRLLLDHGADINARYDGGGTALSLANDESHTAIADYLRSRGGVV